MHRPNMMLTPPMSHWHFHSTVDADFTFVDSKETEKITESKFLDNNKYAPALNRCSAGLQCWCAR